MVRMKVIQIESRVASSDSPAYDDLKRKEVSKVEEFIAQIGYDTIRNIIVSSPGNNFSYYSIFYEDGQPYTPYAE